jgi:hypothetical protein
MYDASNAQTAISCSTCRARYDEAQWRALRLTERLGPSDAARFVVGWSPALCVEVRACGKCGNQIARRRAAAE